MDIPLALQIARPGAQWSVGETYASLQWLDQVQIKPTEEELAAAWQTHLAMPPRRQWSTSEFFARFTPQEQAALVGSDDAQMRVLRFTLSLHPTVESDNPQLLAGLAYAVQLGLLTEAREQEILQ